MVIRWGTFKEKWVRLKLEATIKFILLRKERQSIAPDKNLLKKKRDYSSIYDRISILGKNIER